MMGTMRVAVLGWGSLLWDKRPEFVEFENQLAGSWAYDGPRLAVEFSRVSSSRDGALTLVLDEHGRSTEVAWRESKRTDPEEALADLAAREGTVSARMGMVVVGDNSRSRFRPENAVFAEQIRRWARDKGFDAVVWTDLPSNFEAKTHHGFSLSEALNHVSHLSLQGQEKAMEYIAKAPAFIHSDIREALGAEPNFQSPEL